MAPNHGAGSDSTPSDTGPTSATHVPVPLAPAGQLAPHQMATVIKQRIDEQLTLVREDRGKVLCPEDTHNTVRQLADWYSQADDYVAAYEQIKTHIEAHAEDELIEAETSKIRNPPDNYTPKRPMRVPASGMTITLTPQFNADRDIDMDSILPVLAQVVWEELSDPDGINLPDLTDDEFSEVVEFSVAVAKRAVDLYRKTLPSVKAVQALGALAGARGADDLASIVNGAVKETNRTYKDRVTLSIKPDTK